MSGSPSSARVPGGPVRQLVGDLAQQDDLRVIAEAGWGVERSRWRVGGRRKVGMASGTCHPISPTLPQSGTLPHFWVHGRRLQGKGHNAG